MKQTLSSRWQALIVRQYSIPEASALFMVAFLISAVLGIVRQALFNAQYGTGMEASAFIAAFRLPETLVNLIAGGTLSNALIPVLAGVSREDGPDAEWELASLVLVTFLALFTLAILIGMIFAPLFITRLLAPGFDAPTSELTIVLTRIMLLEAILGLVTSVIMAVLNSRYQFTLSALSIIVHNTTLITGILLSRGFPQIDIYGAAVGVIGDGILQLLILLPGMRANRFRFTPRWNLADKRLREVIRLMVPNGLSGVVNYAGVIAETSYASLVQEKATLSAIQNALLLIGLPVRLLGTAIGQAAFPRLAGIAAAKEWTRLRRTILVTFGIAIILAMPVIVFFITLGRPLVRLVFERGRFSATDGDLTYTMLAAYSIAIPAYIGTDMMTRGLTALRDTTTPLFTNIGQLVIRIGLISLLIVQIGPVGIPIGFTISAYAETITLALVLLFRLRQQERQ